MFKTTKPTKSINLDLLRIIAILLVLNSHSDSLYPENLAKLAAGGIIGDTLFFVLSGYLYPQKIDLKKFGQKLLRIYPSVWLVTILEVIFQHRFDGTFLGALKIFIWPTNWWFLAALLIYWVIGLLLQKLSTKQAVCGFAGLYIAYFAVVRSVAFFIEEQGLSTPESWSKVIYFFGVFLAGYLIRKHKDILLQHINAVVCILPSVGGIVCYYGLKKMIAAGIVPVAFQVIMPLFLICFAAATLLFTLKIPEPQVNNKLRYAVSTVASLSLGAYLVHRLVLDAFIAKGIRSVAMVLFSWVVTMAMAYCLKIVVNIIAKNIGTV